MTEGEIKRRILELNENGMWDENDYSLSAHEVFDILDEAKREYPITLDCITERDKWFKKYFGKLDGEPT